MRIAHRLRLAAHAGHLAAHGEPLGLDEVKATKENLGWPLEPTFCVPDEVLCLLPDGRTRGAEAQARLGRAAAPPGGPPTPELAARWDRAWRGEPAPGWDEALPVYAARRRRGHAQRAGAVINAIAPHCPP